MRSLSLIGLTTVLFALSGCGTSLEVLQGPTGVSPSPSPSENAVQQMVDTENQYRLSIGDEALVPGLICTLYSAPTTTTAIIGATGLTNIGSWDYTGVFNQPNGPVTAGLNVMPSSLRSQWQSWYIMKCTGSLVISDDNWHYFDISSDDGSNLYVDGLLINNDGLHGAQDKGASEYLKYGFHTFELDYLQGAGNEALILSEDGSVMQAAGFYH